MVSTSSLSRQSSPVPLDVRGLPSLTDMGFTGGRDSFRAFCATIFQEGQPRFLRTSDDALVVFRHTDLRAFSILPEVANVPPAVLFKGMLEPFDQGEPPVGAGIARVISNQVFTANPPIHGPIRKILLKQFGPKQAAGMADTARETIAKILEEIGDATEIDFVEDVAEKLTARFWGGLIGMTEDEIAHAAKATRDMTALFIMDKSAEDFQQADRAVAEYGRLVQSAALRGVSAGHHPLVSELAADLATLDLPDDPDEAGIVPKDVGALLAGNLVDGFHTAAVAATNTLYALLRHPEVYAQVKAMPNLTSAAVMEGLRCEPPVLFLNRYVIRDVVIDGLIIPKGTLVAMLWAAGNYDPSVFPDPQSFRLDRAHSGITTFGGGTHICPGRNVALMLVRTLLESFEEQGVELSLIERDYSWFGNHVMGQLRSMPLKVRRRTPDGL